jgi:hypothetical protein
MYTKKKGNKQTRTKNKPTNTTTRHKSRGTSKETNIWGN